VTAATLMHPSAGPDASTIRVGTQSISGAAVVACATLSSGDVLVDKRDGLADHLCGPIVVVSIPEHQPLLATRNLVE